MSDIGPTHFPTYARDINSKGIVLLGVRLKDGIDSAILSDGQSTQSLRTDQCESVDVRALNDSAVVVGAASLNGISYACAWRNGQFTFLDEPGDYWGSCAHDINEQETIVGFHVGRAGPDTHVYWSPGVLGHTWRYTEFFPDFVPFEQGGGMAMAINNRHMIAGVVAGQAFVKVEDRYLKIAAPNASGLWPYGINSYGVVIGSAIEPDEEYAFRYTTRVESLGTIAGSNSQALAINDHGSIVGSSTYELAKDDLHGFIWNNGEMSDLNDLIVNRGKYVIESGNAINNAGQIAATATLNGVDRAVLLTPDR